MFKKTDINKIKPEDKTKAYLDYNGLYLVVDPKSNKYRHGRYYWRYRTEFQRKTYKKVLGDHYIYHHDRAKFKVNVSLDEARAKAMEFRKEIEQGLNEIFEKPKEDPLLSEYPEHYAKHKRRLPKALNKKGEMNWQCKAMKDVQREFNRVIDRLEDRPAHKYSKVEISDMIIDRLKNQTTQFGTFIKTNSIRRNFNDLVAVINYVNDKLEIDHRHRFSRTEIPNEGEDKTEKIDYTSQQLATLRRVVEGSDNFSEQMIALMIDTGMRSGEIVGLKSEDLILDCEQPYIKLHKNSLRRLKTKSSARFVPLTGASLEITKYLDLDKEWLFDRYLQKDVQGKDKLNTVSANKTINNNIHRMLGKDAPTSHSFRHTLRTRLSSVGCPKSLREEMGGWASSVSDNYGTPDDMMIKGDYLRASLKW